MVVVIRNAVSNQSNQSDSLIKYLAYGFHPLICILFYPKFMCHVSVHFYVVFISYAGIRGYAAAADIRQ